jgi:predicted permease
MEVEDHVASSGEISPLFWLNIITPDYFRVMNIPVVSGRDFKESDSSDSHVAVITAETARRFWPNQDAVGKHVRLFKDKDWRTIVGVVADVRAYDLQRNVPNWIGGTAYVPYNSTATLEDARVPSEMTVVVRTDSDNSRTEGLLRSAMASFNPEVPISEVKSMNAVCSDAVAAPRSSAFLFIVFSGLALTLGAIGIYGVLSFLVSNRTREIGIRMALGSPKSAVLWSVMNEGGKFTLLGISLGVAGAFVLMRVLSSELYGISSNDPATFGAVSLIVAGIASLACYVPARRAMQVDPLVALRYE